MALRMPENQKNFVEVCYFFKPIFSIKTNCLYQFLSFSYIKYGVLSLKFTHFPA